MTRHVATIVIGALLLSACDGAGDVRRSGGTVVVREIEASEEAADLVATDECRCWWARRGYPTMIACLDVAAGESMGDRQRTCLVRVMPAFGRFADHMACLANANATLAVCLSQAACIQAAFDNCHSRFDAADVCGDPCAGLGGDDATACRAEFAAMTAAVDVCLH